jgi:hypothetical protein
MQYWQLTTLALSEINRLFAVDIKLARASHLEKKFVVSNEFLVGDEIDFLSSHAGNTYSKYAFPGKK